MLACMKAIGTHMHIVISNRHITLSAHRLLLLAVVRPTLEYGSEVWEANKAQAAALVCSVGMNYIYSWLFVKDLL